MAELSNQLNQVFKGIPFVIGGEEGHYELMLSPEGHKDKIYLTRYWKEQAPPIQGWTFFHLKQPKRDFNFNIKLEGCDILVGPDDFFVSYKPNEDRKKIDIIIYCEKLLAMDEQTQLMYIFLMLDECLGEGYTKTAIGEIQIAKNAMPDSILLRDLLNIVIKTYEECDWQLLEDPDEMFSGYEIKPKENSSRYRDDIFFGYTSNMNLINSSLQGDSESIDYINSVGSAYVYLVYNHGHVPNEKKIEYRSEIEDALALFLSENHLGYILGGATGTKNSYIDLLVFDMKEFDHRLGEVLQNFNTKIECFPF